MQIERYEGGFYWGVGIDTDIELASMKALVNAINRSEGGGT